MGTRCCAAVIIGMVGCLAAPAQADPKAEIAAKARAAMVSYDSMDYETAQKLLNQALALAKKTRLDRDPITARVYLELAIAQLASSDQEAARVSLLSAAQIDPKITIGAAYKSPELVKLLDEAKAAAGDGAETSDGVDCKTIRGLQHTVVDRGKPGVAQPIEAWIGRDLVPARVVVMYRAEGAIDFSEAKLTRQAGCKYTATIPASATRGSVVHYYVAAYDASNQVLAAKGSSGAPNVLALGAPSVPVTTTRRPSDAEDAVDRSARPTSPAGGPAAAIASPAPEVRAATAPRFLFAVSGGTGFGYVTGKTEGNNQVQTCCIGTSLVVVTPELAYAMTRQLSIGLAARLGFPIGANMPGHSVIAPAGFVRVHYGLSESGDGLRVMGELGAGILRNTIKVSATMPGLDTDVVAQGPLLFGAGLGYATHVSASLAFLVNVDAIAGIAVLDKVSTAVHLNTGISADMSVGLAMGF